MCYPLEGVTAVDVKMSVLGLKVERTVVCTWGC